ncbi:MAG: nucleotidyltransferase family protein [Betaproteobacteria bacterium]|nr:nucleotidyltransferase family protein [Betaproteobacteria bacterium]
MNWAAVLLAAGAGSRMGHRPKSLLLLDGKPLIRRQVLALLGAGVTQLVVVLGHYADHIATPLQGLPLTLVQNPQPEDGLVSSQRLGLQALPDGLGGVVMALADQPLIEASDVQQLMQQFAERPPGTHMVYPLVKGQPGNPVMLSSQARLAILAGHAAMGCKEWRQAHPKQVQPFPSDNWHFVTDMDHLEDLADFEQRTGRRLTWPAQWSPE